MRARVWWVTQPLRVPVEKRLTLTHSQLLGISGQGLALGWGHLQQKPLRHPQDKGHLMQPCGLNRTWLCGGHNLCLGLRDLYFPYQNPAPLSGRHEGTYGDKGHWGLNKSCPGTSTLVFLQARAKSAPWKEGAPLGEGRWADTTSSLN